MEPSRYFQVVISAEDRAQAEVILNGLLEKKLAVGGQLMAGPARFWWNGEINDLDYCTVLTWTLAPLKDELVAEVERVSAEEVPMISFVAMDGNDAFLNWIEETLGSEEELGEELDEGEAVEEE
jgi:uncharacterized protein involved in tolerance to divalent cations